LKSNETKENEGYKKNNTHFIPHNAGLNQNLNKCQKIYRGYEKQKYLADVKTAFKLMQICTVDV